MRAEASGVGTGERERGLLDVMVGDGRPLLFVTAASLMFSGGLALFLSASRQFLPQDVAFLKMTPTALCRLDDCRVLDFMIHDRVSFGGALIAIGALYLWLVAFPLSRGEAWAWWTLAASGAIGFGSFLAYLGYGYLDTWHGIGTLLLLPVFVVGMLRSRGLLTGERGPGAWWRAAEWTPWSSRAGIGRLLMLTSALAMAVGGLTILWVGMTRVFVATDLVFMHTTKAALDSVNPRLVPLLAHDRAGFGGAVCTTGLTAAACVWCARPERSLREALALSWIAASATAIGIHLIVGYTSAVHLAPAVIGAFLFLTGLVLSAPARSAPGRAR